MRTCAICRGAWQWLPSTQSAPTSTDLLMHASLHPAHPPEWCCPGCRTPGSAGSACGGAGSGRGPPCRAPVQRGGGAHLPVQGRGTSSGVWRRPKAAHMAHAGAPCGAHGAMRPDPPLACSGGTTRLSMRKSCLRPWPTNTQPTSKRYLRCRARPFVGGCGVLIRKQKSDLAAVAADRGTCSVRMLKSLAGAQRISRGGRRPRAGARLGAHRSLR